MPAPVDPNFDRERNLFLDALERPDAAERSAFLDGACGHDSALRARIEALICSHTTDSFLEEPAPDAKSKHLLSVRDGDVLGTVIGRYTLLEKLGEGGCGVVYVAEQTEPVRRKVALKLIKAGMDTRQVIARFEAERQALALMDHPHIARVLDAGTIPQCRERPYFVMELVQGERITEFCRRHALSVPERLRLFIQVCEAVQHAHQKGIIHRDLKPSNILVSGAAASARGNPIPKVIDFGVAKAVAGRLTNHTVVTELTQLIGTPAYMSPEQALLTSEDIDTRSDIYSLGVVLYELLTGTPPWSNQELLTAGLDEMRRIIREVEPERPSQRFRESLLQSEAVAASRQSAADSAVSDPGGAERGLGERENGGALTSRRYRWGGRLPDSPLKPLPADLDWIVIKCLEKDRARRYETAAALAVDLGRFLENEPVLARPPSRMYRFSKFLRRHRMASAAISLVLLAVCLGAAVSTWALLRERAARVREQTTSELANQRLHAALGFVDQVLTNVAPRIRFVAGATEAQKHLLQACLNFMQTLRESAGDNPEARVALVRLLLYIGNQQNPGEPNTSGDYAAGLKHAEEALELLRAPTPGLTETEHGALMREGQWTVIHCLYGLARWEEGLKRSQEVLTEMDGSPARAGWSSKHRIHLLGNAGLANFTLGRTNEALECARAILNSDWAREITKQLETAHWEEIQFVLLAHDVAGNVYGLLLKQFDAMLPHAAESVRIGELLMSRDAGNPHFANLTAQCRAWHGYALMRTGSSTNGIAVLSQARREIEVRAAAEGASDAFRRNRMIIAGIQALAYAGWSEDVSASLPERRRRLLQAEMHLTEAEEYSRTVKSGTRTLPAARDQVAAARAKLHAEERPPVRLEGERRP